MAAKLGTLRFVYYKDVFAFSKRGAGSTSDIQSYTINLRRKIHCNCAIRSNPEIKIKFKYYHVEKINSFVKSNSFIAMSNLLD